MAFSGCAIVDCDHAFPTADWYWSHDAIRCREEHRQERQRIEQQKKIDAQNLNKQTNQKTQ